MTALEQAINALETDINTLAPGGPGAPPSAGAPGAGGPGAGAPAAPGAGGPPDLQVLLVLLLPAAAGADPAAKAAAKPAAAHRPTQAEKMAAEAGLNPTQAAHGVGHGSQPKSKPAKSTFGGYTYGKTRKRGKGRRKRGKKSRRKGSRKGKR